MRQGTSWLAEQILASQEKLCSMRLVSLPNSERDSQMADEIKVNSAEGL